jgi:hypothetical protein
MLHRLGFVLLFFTSTLAPSAEIAPAVIPSEIKAVTRPLWVSAAAAADSETVLNWNRLGLSPQSSLGAEIQAQREALAGEASSKAASGAEVRWIQDRECRTRLEVLDHRGGDDPSSSLKDLLAYSKNIFWGTLRSLTPGFTSGAPATLLEIEVEGRLRGNDADPSETVYVSHSSAAFSVGSFQFCSSRGWRPSAGDRVLIFDYTGPRGTGASLYLPREEQMVFASAGSGLILPPQLQADPDLAKARDWDELIRRLERKR